MALPLSFQIGEKVVYPNQGVGTVENISSRSFGTQPERFYLLRMYGASLTVLVPFSHVDDIGLRRITKNGEIGRVLEFLGQGRCRCSHDWKNRFKENSEKMRVGGLLQIAEVMKTLLMLQLDKPLSFREKKMLDRARRMLIAEIAISRSIAEPGAEELLQRALFRASLTLPPPL